MPRSSASDATGTRNSGPRLLAGYSLRRGGVFGVLRQNTWAHFWLARFAFVLQVISQGRLALERNTTSAIRQRVLRRCTVKFHLCSGAYEECAEPFERGAGVGRARKLTELIDEGRSPTEPPRVRTSTTRDTATHRRHPQLRVSGQRRCRAERGVDLEEAGRLIGQARQGCAMLDGTKWRDRIQAFSDDCEGWNLIKRSLFQSAISLDRAIVLLQAGARVLATPEAHYHLASAYHLKLVNCVDKVEGQRWRRLATENIRHAQELTRTSSSPSACSFSPGISGAAKRMLHRLPPQRQDAAASAACQMERAALLREPTSTPPAP